MRMIPGEENNNVSIIVVNWNGERFLKDCVRSLSNKAIVIVRLSWLITALPRDNSVCFTKENFPEVLR